MFGFLKRKKKDPRAELKRVLGDYELPTFPQTAQSALQKLRDPNADAASIAQVISGDPGISVKVLTTVNSAAFATTRKVEDLTHAVTMLGTSALESLLLSVAVGCTCPQTDMAGFNLKQFWQAGALRAAVARGLAQILHPATRAQSFTAGLLQDMAIPFLVLRNPEDYVDILKRYRAGEADLAELEREKFGWDHAEVATWICSEWELPESLASAIGAHHGDVSEGLSAPPAVLLVGPIRDNPENPGTEQVVKTAQEKHGVEPEKTEAIIEEGRESSQEIAKLFS